MNHENYKILDYKERIAADLITELLHHLNRIADALETIVALEGDKHP